MVRRGGLVVGQQEVSGRHPGRRELLSGELIEPGLLETLRRRLPRQLGVGVEQIKGSDSIPDGADISPMPAAGSDQPLNDRNQEGAGPAGRLDQAPGTEILVLRVSDEVEDQLDDPATGEDLAVVGVRVVGQLSEGHPRLD